MKLVLTILALPLALLALPILLLVAVALGPVILGILCALLCALVIFALWSLAVGVGLFGRSLERAGMRRVRHAQGAHHSPHHSR